MERHRLIFGAATGPRGSHPLGSPRRGTGPLDPGRGGCRGRWPGAAPGLLRAALALAVLGALAWPRLVRADAIDAEAILLTTHLRSQRDAPVELYTRRLDRAGRDVLTPGLKLAYDHDLAEPLLRAPQLRIVGGLLSDSIRRRFGFAAVLARWVPWQGERLAGSIQAGPGLIFRQSWRDVPGYNPDNPLHQSARFLPGYEWLVLPLVSLDLLVRFTPGLEGVWSVFPGVPYVIMQSLGLRWSF